MHSRWISTACLIVLVSALALMPFMVSAEPLKAVFEAHPPTSGIAPFTVRFFDHSAAEFSRLWNFGDGGTSTLPDPEHTYANPGSYTVALTAYDQTGTISDTKTIPNCIVVSSEGGGLPYSSPTPGITDTYPTVTATTVPSTTVTPALTGTIEVISVPAGAMFSLDGFEQGIAPYTAYAVQVGKHTVKVHTKGYVDNETPVTVENQKTVQLKIVLAASGAKLSSSPTPTQSPVATITETSTTEAQKASAYVPTTVPGVIHIRCVGCLDRFTPSNINNGIFYKIDNKRQEVYAHTSRSDEMSISLTPDSYTVQVGILDYNRQTKWVNVTQGRTTDVEFIGSTFVKTPGFTTLLAVLAIAGIIGIRRMRR